MREDRWRDAARTLCEFFNHLEGNSVFWKAVDDDAHLKTAEVEGALSALVSLEADEAQLLNRAGLDQYLV
ncbi:MAG TPA: hypothetical protein VFA94_15640 [Acidimicrobiales bacterium]|nr:hypothetical protein [Acidimicrobiales bacterium]